MSDERYMETALDLALGGEGGVNPNPLVGAVVVKDGEIVGQGYHRAYGGPHAEAYALEEAGGRAHGATLYVTLEPCCHHGKTPPCVERITTAGITRVVIPCIDPNPLVNGSGVRRLRDAGIEVEVGVLEERARRLNEIFFHFVTTGRPFVELKLAVSLDGRIATRTGDSRWISGEASRVLGHRLRRRLAAVLIGVGTVISDDPALTVRHVPGRNPLRVVLDGEGRTPLDARLLREEGRTVVATSRMPAEREAGLAHAGASVWRLPDEGGRVDLTALLGRLGREGIDSVLVEGGGETAAAFLEAGLVDKVSFFIAPLLLGGRQAVPAVGGLGSERVADGIRLDGVEVTRVGEDVLYTGSPGRRQR